MYDEMPEYGTDCDDPMFINILRASNAAAYEAQSEDSILNEVSEHFTKATFVVIWAVWLGLMGILFLQARRMC